MTQAVSTCADPNGPGHGLRTHRVPHHQNPDQRLNPPHAQPRKCGAPRHALYLKHPDLGPQTKPRTRH